MPFTTRGGHRSNPTPPGHFGGWKAVLVALLFLAFVVLYVIYA